MARQLLDLRTKANVTEIFYPFDSLCKSIMVYAYNKKTPRETVMKPPVSENCW